MCIGKPVHVLCIIRCTNSRTCVCVYLSNIRVSAQSLSRVRLFGGPWLIAHQAPLSMGFSRQNTGVGCHFLLQGIFTPQGSHPGLLCCRQILYHLSHQGTPCQICYCHNLLLTKSSVADISGDKPEEIEEVRPWMKPRYI